MIHLLIELSNHAMRVDKTYALTEMTEVEVMCLKEILEEANADLI